MNTLTNDIQALQNRIAELEREEQSSTSTIAALTESKSRLVAQMAADYYEYGTRRTREVAIKEVGPHAFYCALVRCCDNLSDDDAAAIINLILD